MYNLSQIQIDALKGYQFVFKVGRPTADGYVNESFMVEGNEITRCNVALIGDRAEVCMDLTRVVKGTPFVGDTPKKWIKYLSEEIFLYFLQYSDLFYEWSQYDCRIRVDVIHNGYLIKTIPFHYSDFA